MNKFYKRLLLFLFPILCCVGGIEYFYRTVPNNYTVKQNYIDTHAKDIEVLLFGDSHCFYGLNPDYFSQHALNLSNVSQTIYFDKLLLEKHIDRLPKLKKVVFCIEYTNLSQADNTGEDDWRKYYYQHYMHLKVPIISKWDVRQYSLTLSQDFNRTMKLIKRYCKTQKLYDCNPNGWGTNYKKEDRIQPSEVAKARAAMQEDGSMDFALNADRLQQMIAECKQRNIEVVIVSMPQTHLFESYLNQSKLQKIIATCTAFQTNNNNVHYLNLFRDERFVDEDFYDADHLNSDGAVKCSKIVNDYLKFPK